MKSETSAANEEISYESDDEDAVVIILDAIHNASGGKIHE